MSWYIQAIKNYFNFSGRARRKEFWMYTLFLIIFTFASMILDVILGIDFKISNGWYEQSLGYGPIYIIVSLFHWIPALSVTVRRLHDSDRTGWWYFGPTLLMLGAVLIGAMFGGLGYALGSESMTITGIVLGVILYLAGIGLAITALVFLFFDGTKGDNRFGPSNKYDLEGHLLTK